MCYRHVSLNATPILFVLVLLPRPSCAQNIAGAPPTSAADGGSPSTRYTETPWPKMRTALPIATSFKSQLFPNSTTSSMSDRATEDITPQLFPDSQSDPSQVRNEGVFNYYFLFLAVFGVLIAAGLWWIHRQRKRRKERMRRSGQNALARDLDGWINTQRWFHGAWRHNQTAAFVRREEGLNEHGEAPPPYEPKSDVTQARDGAASSRDANAGPLVPLRALSRDEVVQARPPEYAIVNYNLNANQRSRIAGQETTRPGTADSNANHPT